MYDKYKYAMTWSFLLSCQHVEGGDIETVSVRPSVRLSEKEVLLHAQFFTDPYQNFTASLYH